MKASISFKNGKLEAKSTNIRLLIIEFRFQVVETSNPKKVIYDMTIGNDIFWNIGINIWYYTKINHSPNGNSYP